MADARVDVRVRSAADQPRFRAGLVGSFAVVAGLLALIGIYDVVGQLVQASTREIEARVAMGAERGRVLRGVLGQAPSWGPIRPMPMGMSALRRNRSRQGRTPE